MKELKTIRFGDNESKTTWKQVATTDVTDAVEGLWLDASFRKQEELKIVNSAQNILLRAAISLMKQHGRDGCIQNAELYNGCIQVSYWADM